MLCHSFLNVEQDWIFEMLPSIRIYTSLLAQGQFIIITLGIRSIYSNNLQFIIVTDLLLNCKDRDDSYFLELETVRVRRWGSLLRNGWDNSIGNRYFSWISWWVCPRAGIKIWWSGSRCHIGWDGCHMLLVLIVSTFIIFIISTIVVLSDGTFLRDSILLCYVLLLIITFGMSFNDVSWR